MAISPDLRRFKATGVYLLSESTSDIISISAPNGMRLLVGNSRQGPVGRPVYFDRGEYSRFVNTFGAISRVDERRGDFSKRAAYFMLQTGPIYYLNIRAFDDSLDKAGQVEISAESKFDNADATLIPYTSLFNTEQFWSVDTERLIDPANREQLLTFANIGTKRVTMFIRKRQLPTSTISMSAWYDNLGKTMPEYVYPQDAVGDWEVDIHMFANDFSDAAANQSNPAYGFLFDANGVMKTVTDELGETRDGIGQLANIPESRYIDTYSGSLIPGFTDSVGNVLDVIRSVNNAVDTHGLIAAFNTEIFDDAAVWEANVDSGGDKIYSNNGSKQPTVVDFASHGICNTIEDGSFDEATYDAAQVKSTSYEFDTVISAVQQSVNDVISADVFSEFASNATLHKIEHAMFPGVETLVGSDYAYSLLAGKDNVIYAFESTKPHFGEKYVSRDGNLATVTDIAFLGAKTYLRGFGTIILPVQPDTVTDFDSGNDGLTNAIVVTADVLCTSNQRYDSGANDSTVAAGTAAPSTIETAVDISAGTSAGHIIKVGTEYFTVVSVTGTTIVVEEDFTGSVPTTGDAVLTADTALVQDTDYFDFSDSGNFEIIDITTANVSTTIAVTDTEYVGVYIGGFAKISLAPFNYTTHVAFPKNTDGLYIYPVGHILADQPVVGKSTSSNQPIHNPTAAGSDYVYQMNADGTYAMPTYPSTGYAPGIETMINVVTGDLSASELAAVRVSDGQIENVYEITLDKPLVVNDVTTGNIGDLTPYTEIGARDTDSLLVLDDSTELIVYNNNNVIFNVKTFEQIVESYIPISLRAYSPRSAQFVDGTATRQNVILDMLTGSGLRNALKNRELIDYEYLVDGFKSYVESSIKMQLSVIASEREVCFAIANMPLMKDFQASTNPYFRQSVSGAFDPKYIARGGNLNLPYTNTFSLPTTGNTYIGFFGPGILINDGGESIVFPPAALVSNNYFQKYVSGKPYDIVGGPDTGRVGGTGVSAVEYVFAEANDGTGDRDVLEPFGYNAIVNKRSTGMQIYGNATAQNNVVNPLSSIHTREIIKYLQSQIAQVLEQFVFKYNTPQNRLLIKTQADSICQPLIGDGALISFDNVCDTTNNTEEVVDAKICVIDSIITTNQGMQILVHRTKVDTLTNAASFEVL